jgi:hypothetical protein
MTIAISSSCGCGCNPCVCTPTTPAGGGTCLPAACLPRPTFFDGQVIGAADLNAILDYARNQQALLARLLGGWGILGGLRLDAAPGLAASALGTGTVAQLSHNPQIVAGTQVQISPGVAIDALGNRLVVCAPVTLDIANLALQTPQARLVTDTCANLLGPECRSPATQITASEFFLVAELNEVAVRPVGRVNGPGSCDPVVGCQFSRTIEDVRFNLVAALPDTYQFTGCVDATSFQLPSVQLGLTGDPMLCRDEVFAFIDNVQQQLATLCCGRPAVVLGKVLLTRSPGALAAGLPFAPQYLIISDAYPCRKPTFQVGWFTKEWPNVICTQGAAGAAIQPGTTVQTAGDHVRESITIQPSSSDFILLNAEGPRQLRAQLERPRLSTSSLAVSFSASFALQTVASADIRVVIDGLALSANGLPLLTAHVGDPTSVRSVEIADVIPPSVLGEPRAHAVQIQISLTAGSAPATGAGPPPTNIVFDPAAFDGASLVIQEIAR